MSNPNPNPPKDPPKDPPESAPKPPKVKRPIDPSTGKPHKAGEVPLGRNEPLA